jgi:hypothetical protein
VAVGAGVGLAPGEGDGPGDGDGDGPPPPPWSISDVSASRSVLAHTTVVGLATMIFWNSGNADDVDCRYTGWR